LRSLKKVFCAAALVIAMSVSTILLTGCGKVLTYGDFTYTIKGGSVLITGLSEQGRQQRFVVIPTEINGKKVDGLLNPNTFPATMGANFVSDNLEKIFFPVWVGADKGIELKSEIGQRSSVKTIVINSLEGFRGGGGIAGNATQYVYSNIFDPSWNTTYGGGH
jgi:hypothetical protein